MDIIKIEAEVDLDVGILFAQPHYSLGEPWASIEHFSDQPSELASSVSLGFDRALL